MSVSYSPEMDYSNKGYNSSGQPPSSKSLLQKTGPPDPWIFLQKSHAAPGVNHDNFRNALLCFHFKKGLDSLRLADSPNVLTPPGSTSAFELKSHSFWSVLQVMTKQRVVTTA